MKDLQIAQRIADTLDGFPELPILEVGPGMGVLTSFLLEKGRPLTLVEIDRESVPYLHEHFPQLRGNVIQADFLRMNLTEVMLSKFCLIGNYPYNISSQIFFKLLDYKDSVPCCSGMIQKEVAERIASPAGKKSYGILSVLLQAWYDVEYLFTVDEHVFDPPPKVKSAVVRLVRNNRTELSCDERMFRTVVKTAFNQRRKTLRNSLKPLLGKANVAYADALFDLRPEQLSVADFENLTRIVQENVASETSL